MLMKEQPELPVVIWSGYLDGIPKSQKWYADALLEKTDGPEALFSTIERLINTGISRKKAIARRTFTIGEPLVAWHQEYR